MRGEIADILIICLKLTSMIVSIYILICCLSSFGVLICDDLDTKLIADKSIYAPEKTACQVDTGWTKIFYSKLFCVIEDKKGK